MTELDTLRDRAEALHLHGLVSHWPEVATAAWVAPLLEWEETQRSCRSLQRRLKTAHIGHFKPLCDFDWNWPKRCDRAAVDALMTLDFLKEAPTSSWSDRTASASRRWRRTSPIRH